MDTKKGIAATIPTRDDLLTALVNLYSNITLLQNTVKVNTSNGKKADKSSKNKKKSIAYNASVRTLNLKFYAEQLLEEYMTDDELFQYYNDLYSDYQHRLQNPSTATLALSKGDVYDYLYDRLKERIESFDSEFQVMYIVHDEDTVADPDDYFLLSSVKSHVHMVIKKRNNQSFRINTLLDKLGIRFRRYVDNELWKHGVATCKNFASCVAYLTHETATAEADGKTIYSRDKIIANCSTSEVDDFREGYLLSNEHRKLTVQELAKLDKQFYDYGYDLKDFDTLYNSLDFITRSNTKIRTITESYERGVQERIKKEPPEINRVCLFIEGPPNTGKTYAINKALKALSHKIYEVTGGGSGKFDKLSITDTAITIDDEVCPNLLNMTDSRITTAYKRNRNNPYWTGNTFVVTSNKKFLSWCTDSGLSVTGFATSPTGANRFDNLTEHGKAMISRFIICEVREVGGCFQIIPNTDFSHLRGTPEEKQEKIARAIEIIELANSIMKDYTQSTNDQVLDFDYAIYLKGEKCMISELKEEYINIFKPLWCSVYPDKDFDMKFPTFDDWISYGADNAYDEKIGFYRE
jgi:hypothetical protein